MPIKINEHGLQVYGWPETEKPINKMNWNEQKDYIEGIKQEFAQVLTDAWLAEGQTVEWCAEEIKHLIPCLECYKPAVYYLVCKEKIEKGEISEDHIGFRHLAASRFWAALIQQVLFGHTREEDLRSYIRQYLDI